MRGLDLFIQSGGQLVPVFGFWLFVLPVVSQLFPNFADFLLRLIDLLGKVAGADRLGGDTVGVQRGDRAGDAV